MYDPLGPSRFFPDMLNGPILREENGDMLLLKGVIPTNYDRHLNVAPELCASYTIRIKNSALFQSHCPVFNAYLDEMSAHFLPHRDKILPKLPQCFDADEELQKRQERLIASLQAEQRDYKECERLLCKFFKSILHRFATFGKYSEYFNQFFLKWSTDLDTFTMPNRAYYEELIREFKVNKSFFHKPELMQRYDEILDYLSQVIAYFYPEPDSYHLQQVERMASSYANTLLHLPAIKEFFFFFSHTARGEFIS